MQSFVAIQNGVKGRDVGTQTQVILLPRLFYLLPMHVCVLNLEQHLDYHK